MADVERAAAKLARGIVRIHRKQRAALAISIVGRFADRVVAVELKHAIETAVETDKELPLIELATRFEPVDLALRRIGTNTVRRERRDARREWRIEVASANHVHDANVVEADEHGHIARQLSFDLRACEPYRRSLNIWINLPDCLLSQGN